MASQGKKTPRVPRDPDIVEDGTVQDQIAASVAAGEAAAKRDIAHPPYSGICI